MKNKNALDEIDYKILRILQQDADKNIDEIGHMVGLSHTPCWRRIKKMEDAGVILAKRCILNSEKVGLDVSIFVHVRLDIHSSEVLEEFEAATQSIPEIMQCYTMSGEFDYLLRVVCDGLNSYERFTREQLTTLPGIRSIESSFALGRVKERGALPEL